MICGCGPGVPLDSAGNEGQRGLSAVAPPASRWAGGSDVAAQPASSRCLSRLGLSNERMVARWMRISWSVCGLVAALRLRLHGQPRCQCLSTDNHRRLRVANGRTHAAGARRRLHCGQPAPIPTVPDTRVHRARSRAWRRSRRAVVYRARILGSLRCRVGLERRQPVPVGWKTPHRVSGRAGYHSRRSQQRSGQPTTVLSPGLDPWAVPPQPPDITTAEVGRTWLNHIGIADAPAGALDDERSAPVQRMTFDEPEVKVLDLFTAGGPNGVRHSYRRLL